MKKLSFILSLLLVLFLNIYFRTFPANFPQLKIQAASITQEKTRENIENGVNKRFPLLDVTTKNRIINEQLRSYKSKNKQAIKDQARKEYLALKERYQDAAGQTYLMEFDCWHWARYVNNVLRLGRVGDKFVNDREVDTLMLAPSGAAIGWNSFLFYLAAFLYKAFSSISSVPLFTFLFYLPLFFSSVFIILLFSLCYLHFGMLCAVVSCLYIGLAPVFLPRSCAGWFDTDIFNLSFPLLIVWSYLNNYKTRTFASKIVWLCFSAFLVGLFCFTWVIWWFIFAILVLYEMYSLFYLLPGWFRQEKNNLNLFRSHLVALVLFTIFSFFWIIVFCGLEPLMSLLTQVKEVFILNKPFGNTIWPNVYATVQELRKPSYLEIIGSSGGVLLFVPALACVALLFLRHLRSRKIATFEHEFRVIILIWFMAMSFACLKGVRFTMFALVPLGIALGWMLNEAYEYFICKNSKLKVLVLLISFLLCIEIIHNAYVRAERIFPAMEDPAYGMLVVLKEKTPPEAVINSWWDWGDWFKVVSERKVIFDGQSQNKPQAYWMARVLLTDNETEAINILRMLNNGGNLAFEIINSHLNDPLKSVLLLKRVVSMERKQAAQELSKFIPGVSVERVSGIIFNKPPAAYFVIDNEMWSKMSSISFLGNWDFIKAYLVCNINKEESGIKGYLGKISPERRVPEKIYQEARLINGSEFDRWISYRLKFYDNLSKGQKENEILLFENGLIYDCREKKAFLYLSESRSYKIPSSILIFENNKLNEISFPDHTLDSSVLVIKDERNWRAILLDTELGKSLFVKLYFLNGYGLKHFKPFLTEEIGNHYIRAFEIIWEHK